MESNGKAENMRQLGKHAGGVLRAALVCGMAIQILLGLAWLIKNTGGLQTFQESMSLLYGRDGAGLHSGVLYKALAQLSASRLWILYGIQLAAALTAAYRLAAVCIGREKRLLCLTAALALVTIPQAMQCHLAVLPWSLGTSLLMGETALWLEIREKSFFHGQGKRAAAGYMTAMLCGWGLLLLILPGFAWFVLPLLIAALWRLGREKGLRLAAALMAMALSLGTVTVNCGWNLAEWNRRLAADTLSRVGWPFLQENYDVIPNPLHDDIGLTTVREVSAYADSVEQVLIPKLETLYGKERVTEVLWELTRICLKENLKPAAKNIIWDMAAYHATPPVLLMQLRGRAYDAFSGVNYEQMKNRAPVLTKYYVRYGGGWWVVMLALALLIRLCCCLEKTAASKRTGKKQISEAARRFAGNWFPVLAGAEWLILSCVFQGSGIMDYKRTLWVTVIWYLAVLRQLRDREGRAEWQ
ncbi:MAG: hypothetical protein K2O34_13880 [Acetatifactor sp.]|nr:hypothetical protein [Acetatifactor sp.]